MTMIDRLKNGIDPNNRSLLSDLVDLGYIRDGFLTESGRVWAKENEIPVVEQVIMNLLSPITASTGKRYPADTEVVVVWVEKDTLCTVLFPDGGISYIYDITRRRRSRYLIRPILDT